MVDLNKFRESVKDWTDEQLKESSRDYLNMIEGLYEQLEDAYRGDEYNSITDELTEDKAILVFINSEIERRMI